MDERQKRKLNIYFLSLIFRTKRAFVFAVRYFMI